MRKKQAMHLDARYVTMVENAYYYCNPPPAEKTVKKKRPPLQEYIRKLLYKDLSKVTTEKVNPFKTFNAVFFYWKWGSSSFGKGLGRAVVLSVARKRDHFLYSWIKGFIFFYWNASWGPVVLSTASNVEQRENEMRIVVFCTLCWENKGQKPSVKYRL